MRWSKLKQQVEAMFAEGVRGRVELRTTRYEKAHDRFGRSWITVDGREIANMSNYLGCGDSIADGNPTRFDAGVFAAYDLPMAMREYLTLSIDKAIASPNPLIRALAVLDRRAGERRLARIDPAKEVPIVRELLTVRRGVRGGPAAASPPNAVDQAGG
jgi:hypothetical protein